MGNSQSSKRMERYYGNYEKSFERVGKDMERVKGQLGARGRRRSNLGMWSSVLIAGAVVVAAALIYQVQQQPQGTLTYQQHFQRTAAAAAVPACALLLHWLAALWMDVAQRRDMRKLQRLEATQRTMLKELKEMINYDKVKALIDRFDPEAQAAAAQAAAVAAMQQGAMQRQANGAAAAGRGRRGQPQGRGQQQPGGQVPAMLVKGSGQVAGAAALAVAGAGKALMPLVDKLATSLISDNPMLLEDLRQAQSQLQLAQERTVGAVQESLGLKAENLELKMRLVHLERELKLEPSFDVDGLQEQQHQLYQQTQQAAWQVELQQQFLGQAPTQGALAAQQHHHQGEGLLRGQGSGGSGSSVPMGHGSSSGDLTRMGASTPVTGSTPPGTPKVSAAAARE